MKIDNKVELDRCSTGRAVNARVGKAAHAIRGAPDCEKLLAWSFSSGFPRTWENGYRLGKGMRDGKDNRLCCHDEFRCMVCAATSCLVVILHIDFRSGVAVGTSFFIYRRRHHG